MDAWWPLLIDYEFKPSWGKPLFSRMKSFLAPDNDPNGDGAHLGSSYDGGWYHYVQQDIRSVLGKRRLKGLRGRPKRGTRLSLHLLRRLGAQARQPEGLPPPHPHLTRPGARRRPEEDLRGRRLRQVRPAERPMVLRHRAPAAGRRDRPAADRVDQPADLPAGGRGQEEGASLR